MTNLAIAVDPVAAAARGGLLAEPKTLPPWLFYDEVGSPLFEQITELPEYYLTRTERALLAAHSDGILREMGGRVTIAELGAGTATKTGLLLAAAVAMQGGVRYAPIDISPTALIEAKAELEGSLPAVTVRMQVANYITEPYRIDREPGHRVLALYIGSSIGNFSPQEARGILASLRQRLRPGDALLLGTDLAPSAKKPVSALLAAYDDAQGVTAAFNRNILARLNRELGADFDLDCFRHEARWNETESRIEMHLVSEEEQTACLPANGAEDSARVSFAAGESIHTENSYKFTRNSVAELLQESGYTVTRTFEDADHLFAVTLASVV